MGISILKVGVAPIYQVFKRRVGCGYKGIILAYNDFVLCTLNGCINKTLKPKFKLHWLPCTKW